MNVLHESRLDNTVDAGSIGIGERVEIRTRMGNQIAVGEVVASTPMGIALDSGSFYQRDLYLFVPVNEEQPVVVKNMLTDGPDARVALKMQKMGMGEADKLDGKLGDEIEKSSIDRFAVKDDDDEATNSDELKKNPEEKPKPLAAPQSSIDVNSLPEDIKKAVVSTTQMDADQLNGVLSEIGDASIKAMKRVNVKENEIYSTVSRIQNAVHRILTGNPPAPPAPPKKNNKK